VVNLIPLRAIEIQAFDAALNKVHPFRLALIRALPRITFTAPVTFFVGENGSGKSTVLEAIACAAGLPTAGAVDLERDGTLAPARALGAQLRLSWSKRSRRGLFLRAEDYFGFVKREAQTRTDLAESRARVDDDLKGSSEYARMLARGVYSKEINALRARYGDGLDARSHGESFLDFFQARLMPNGLHLLDEPEAPLSPQRQLTLLALLKHAIGDGAQFIIATHSPILMAFPNATILEFAQAAITPVAYEDTEHYRISSAFLKNPAAFLDRL
jgi:predicted ATPase